MDKTTGKLIWKCTLPDLSKHGKYQGKDDGGYHGRDAAGFSSVVAADIQGIHQCVQLVGRGVIGVEAATGKFLWGYNRVANDIGNVTSPVVRGNLVFATTYLGGSAVLRITRNDDQMVAEEICFHDCKTLGNHHGGVVLVGDYVYGSTGEHNGTLVCMKLATGEIAWREPPLEKGSTTVLYADGHLYLGYQRGTMFLVEARPDKLVVTGRFKPPARKTDLISHSVILDKKLYLRDADVLQCYDLAK
jgi:outer membrane protein assembly factor BamB